MKRKLNPITNFVEAFRREPLSYILCYGAIAILLIGLFELGSERSRLASILAIVAGSFSAIYFSFSIHRRDIDQSDLSRRMRVSYLLSAAAFLLIYLRLGFGDVVAGPIWLYVIISLILIFVGAPLVAGKSSSEQGDAGKPDPVPS